MEPFKPKGKSWPEDEPTHKADIIFEFIAWCRQRGYTFNELTTMAHQFKKQYQD